MKKIKKILKLLFYPNPEFNDRMTKPLKKLYNKIPWDKPIIMIICVIILFPFGVYLMWKNKIWLNKTKWKWIVITASVIGGIIFFGDIIGNSYERRDDISRWGKIYIGPASNACKPHLEKKLKYRPNRYKWTNWGHIFTSMSWYNKEKGIIKYHGDQLEIQNAFGAYRRVNYSCIYDPENDSVLKTYISDK